MKKSLFLEKANIEKTAKKYVLENANGMRMEFTDFGAIVLSLMIKDKDGIVRDVVLGFQQMKDYLRNDMGMGAYIGRNANRIKDAKVTIDLKRILRLPSSLHSKVSMKCMEVKNRETFDPFDKAVPKFVYERKGV